MGTEALGAAAAWLLPVLQVAYYGALLGALILKAWRARR